VLDRLAEEHRVIHGVLDSVDQALARFIGAPDDLTERQEITDLLSVWGERARTNRTARETPR
jgi:hypothetical protein